MGKKWLVPSDRWKTWVLQAFCRDASPCLSFEENLIAKHYQINPSAEGFVEEGGVLGFGFHEILGEGGGGLGVEEGEVGGLAFGDGWDVEGHEAAGLGGVFFDEGVPAEFSFFDEVVVEGDDGGIEAGDAVGGAYEILGFLEWGVGGVVGGDEVEGAVEEAFEEALVVRFGAERGVHFVMGVEIADVLVGEEEVVG